MDYSKGCFIGRIWDNSKNGPCLIRTKDGNVYDITSKEIPTVRDLLELEDIKKYLNNVQGIKLISVPFSLFLHFSILILVLAFPFAYICEYFFPLLKTITCKCELRALTTEIPTQCKPPEVL